MNSEIIRGHNYQRQFETGDLLLFSYGVTQSTIILMQMEGGSAVVVNVKEGNEDVVGDKVGSIWDRETMEDGGPYELFTGAIKISN